MKSSQEYRADGETSLSQANGGSMSSLADTSKDFRINVRKNRIEVKRADRRKPSDQGDNYTITL